MYVSDNYHGGDDDGPCRAGEFESLSAAIEKCKRIIDDFLEERHRGGMDAEGKPKTRCPSSRSPSGNVTFTAPPTGCARRVRTRPPTKGACVPDANCATIKGTFVPGRSALQSKLDARTQK